MTQFHSPLFYLMRLKPLKLKSHVINYTIIFQRVFSVF